MPFLKISNFPGFYKEAVTYGLMCIILMARKGTKATYFTKIFVHGYLHLFKTGHCFSKSLLVRRFKYNSNLKIGGNQFSEKRHIDIYLHVFKTGHCFSKSLILCLLEGSKTIPI